MILEQVKSLLIIIKISYYLSRCIVLYVKDDSIWVNGKEEVDKLLIDMIGKLDIKFYGADGKHLYQYRSIKHIKDCIICIKANKTIIK